jgi:hypothetical protein
MHREVQRGCVRCPGKVKKINYNTSNILIPP